MNQARHLSVAETARLIRPQIKKAFPGVKFSVRSSSYAGGASIRVSWTNGPTVDAVNAIAGQFSGASFDGMIDLKHYNSSWLMLDGTAYIAKDTGTEGSMGTHAAIDNDQPEAGAELVSFAADFIFCERTISEDIQQAKAIEIAESYAGFTAEDIAELKAGTREANEMYSTNAKAWLSNMVYRALVELELPIAK